MRSSCSWGRRQHAQRVGGCYRRARPAHQFASPHGTHAPVASSTRKPFALQVDNVGGVASTAVTPNAPENCKHSTAQHSTGAGMAAAVTDHPSHLEASSEQDSLQKGGKQAHGEGRQGPRQWREHRLGTSAWRERCLPTAACRPTS